MASTSEQIDQNKQEKQKDEEIDSRTPAEITFDKAQEKSVRCPYFSVFIFSY